MNTTYVNLGCGAIHHPRWLNLDVEPTDPAVRPLDVRKGIPLANGAAAACFSSHVIEHLSPDAARGFLEEQWRVLGSGGIIRVVCPDLAEIARAYLSEHDRALVGGVPTFQHQHHVAELVDQMVRTEPGGRLAQLWEKATPFELEWVVQRTGYVSEKKENDGKRIRCGYFKKACDALSDQSSRYRAWRRIRELHYYCLAWVIGGARLAEIVREGMFRSRGEVHLWMYDAITLSAALASVGFVNMRRRGLGESDIPDWVEYGLEIRHGEPLKPHSLVIEARKL